MRRTVVLTAVAVLVLAGCGTARSSPGSTAPGAVSAAASDLPAAASTPSGDVTCPTSTDPGTDQGAALPGVPLLPSDIAPVTVVRCRVEQRDLAGRGRWTVVVQERADSGLEVFVAAMRVPDEVAPDNQACPANLVLVPWFAVVDGAGRVLQVRMPLDACHQPQKAVLAAFDALAYHQVSMTPLRQDLTASQLAAQGRADALGCSFQFKDMITIVAADPPSSTAPPVLATSPSAVVVCRYVVSASDPQVLEFVSGARASATQTSAIVAGLQQSTPVQACSQNHHEVVGIFQDGLWALVEGDGCHRATGDMGGLHQAAPAALAALTAVVG